MSLAGFSLCLALSAAPVLAPDGGTSLPAPRPFQPRVADPLLAPAPPAAIRVSSWEESLALLRQRSTDERSAEANVERAQGRWRQALGLMLPNARVAASGLIDVLHPDTPPLGAAAAATGAAVAAGATANPPTAPLATGTLSLTQSLVDLGAWRGLSAASAATRGARASLEDVRRRLTQGLARSLVAVVAAERVAELNRVGLRLGLERSALAARMLELGAGTQLDLVRVQQDVEVARGAVISGDEQLRRTREALGLALGLEQAAGVTPDFGLKGLVEQTRGQCQALPSLESRADLEAGRANLESAQSSRRQATAGYLPTLGLTSSLFGYTTSPGPGRFATWNVAAVLSVPLWEGGTRAGVVQERSGLEVQAAEALESTRRQAAFEVARSRRGVEVAEALLRSAAEARALAERTDELTRRSFEVGRGSSLELVQSAAVLRQADVILATREFEVVQARLDAFLTEARCDW